MSDSKNSNTLYLEELIPQLQQQVLEVQQEAKEAATIQRAAKKEGVSEKILAHLRAQSKICRENVQFAQAEVDKALSQLEISSLIDADGAVWVKDLPKVDINNFKHVKIPVVEVLPMRGDVESEESGTMEGAPQAMSPFVNIQRYGPLIELAFDKSQVDEEKVGVQGEILLEKYLSPEAYRELRAQIALGEREPVRLIAKKVAVVVQIETCGGSAPEGYNLGKKIRREAKKSGLPVFTFTNDHAFSAGYFILSAGDEAYATTPFTEAGSIGVVATVQKLSERGQRMALIKQEVYTAGENKRDTASNPHIETSEKDKQKIHAGIQRMHEHFKDYVRESRGNRLKGDEAEMFSGEQFDAEDAVKMGLIDGVVQMEDFLTEKFGEEVVVSIMPVTDPALTQRYLPATSGVHPADEGEDDLSDPKTGENEASARHTGVQVRAVHNKNVRRTPFFCDMLS